MGPIADSGARNRADLHDFACGNRCPWRTSRAATAPITITAGDSIGVVASSSRRQRAMTSSAVVAERDGGDRRRRVEATGDQLGGDRRRAGRRPSAPRSVPPTLASDRQSTSRLAGRRRWPVTTVTAADTPRWVTGMPAAAGAATADVMPGTTSNATPASLSAAASSPPRPKTNGSPPFRRTTAPVAGGRARRAGSRSAPGAPDGRAACRRRSARRPAGTRASTPSPTRASCTTTSASASEPGGADGQQVGVTGTGTDEGDHDVLGRRPARRTTGSGSHVAIVSRADACRDQSPNVGAPCRPTLTRRSGRRPGASVAASWSSGTSRADALAQPVAGRRAADVDVVALLGPPDDADLAL